MTVPVPSFASLEAVVFDLDGTLIDSAPDIRLAINQVLAEDGLTPLPLPLVTSFIGHGVARLAERILAELDLAQFCSVVIGGDSCDERKPDPEPLLACLEALGAERSRSLYIGDSETDVQTARAAGVPVLVVADGYAAVEACRLGADGVIDRIDRWVEGRAG